MEESLVEGFIHSMAAFTVKQSCSFVTVIIVAVVRTKIVVG